MLGLELHDFKFSKQVLYSAIVNNLPIQPVSILMSKTNKQGCESLSWFDADQMPGTHKSLTLPCLSRAEREKINEGFELR